MSEPASTAHEPLAEVTNHEQLVDAFRIIKERRGLSNAFCDEIGGLTIDHTNKLLGPRRVKKIGEVTFDTFCELFAVKFVMVVNPEAVKRMESRWERRNTASIRVVLNKLSSALFERAKPHVIRDFARAGGIKSASGRNERTTPAQRSRIARKAANAMWKKRKLAKAELPPPRDTRRRQPSRVRAS